MPTLHMFPLHMCHRQENGLSLSIGQHAQYDTVISKAARTFSLFATVHWRKFDEQISDNFRAQVLACFITILLNVSTNSFSFIPNVAGMRLLGMMDEDHVCARFLCSWHMSIRLPACALLFLLVSSRCDRSQEFWICGEISWKNN